MKQNPNPDLEEWFVQVSDLRQMEYCSRVLYYRYCLSTLRPTTASMEIGERAHQTARLAEQRRSLSRYGLPNGTRKFDVLLSSSTLHISGRLDLLIEVDEPEKQIFPVEYKDSREVHNNHKIQLAAYAFLIEEAYSIDVTQGFIYLLPLRKVETINLSAKLKFSARQRLQQLIAMIDSEKMPPAATQRGRCIDCEFLHFCNDIF